ncbi:MAG: class I SAM-dependent methyltransferase [Chloroflexi bacterium]|nr:class I SAM-dependent methyltransferase [Chloroflexota bacterium]
MADRQRREAQWHDQAATAQEASAAYFYRWGLSQRATEYAYAQLGALPGRRVLDLGCGRGETLLRLARDGAEVVGIDVSDEMVHIARQFVQAQGLTSVQVHQMPAEQLDFQAASFDVVHGVSVIHHLEVERAAPEIARVLRPGGRAVFVEPLNRNPLLNLFRRLTPGRRTRDEKPLADHDLALLSEPFAEMRRADFGLTLLLVVFLPVEPVFKLALRVLESLDDWLLRRWPGLGAYCWITVITLVK